MRRNRAQGFHCWGRHGNIEKKKKAVITSNTGKISIEVQGARAEVK